MPDNVHTKFLLNEDEMPRSWYNIAADRPRPPDPVLHPGTKQPVTPDDLSPLFPMALIMQEVSTERYIEIPEPIRQVYMLWRLSPLYRARRLEKALDTPARFITSMKVSARRKPQAKYRGGASFLQQGRGRQETLDRNWSGAVGISFSDGWRIFQHGNRNFHGEDQLPAEALPAQFDGNLWCDSACQPY